MSDVTLRVEYWLESEVPGKAFMKLLYIWLFLTSEKTQLASMEFKSIVHWESCTQALRVLQLSRQIEISTLNHPSYSGLLAFLWERALRSYSFEKLCMFVFILSGTLKQNDVIDL